MPDCSHAKQFYCKFRWRNWLLLKKTFDRFKLISVPIVLWRIFCTEFLQLNVAFTIVQRYSRWDSIHKRSQNYYEINIVKTPTSHVKTERMHYRVRGTFGTFDISKWKFLIFCMFCVHKHSLAIYQMENYTVECAFRLASFEPNEIIFIHISIFV